VLWIEPLASELVWVPRFGGLLPVEKFWKSLAHSVRFEAKVVLELRFEKRMKANG
jgi:hypothetical protein